ncbi:MAG: YceI family protein [Ferruginibacter sp.]
MEEHFNENYLESDKFPKAQFKGVITNWTGINLQADGKNLVKVSGQLSMHGKTQEVQISGTLLIAAGKITGQSTFTVKLADYQIEVPRLVKNNISETIEIRVNCLYDHSL